MQEKKRKKHSYVYHNIIRYKETFGPLPWVRVFHFNFIFSLLGRSLSRVVVVVEFREATELLEGAAIFEIRSIICSKSDQKSAQ